MRQDMKELLKRFPILNKEYNMPVLQKVADEAAELGISGIDKNMDKLDDYETRLLVSLMAMTKAVDNDTFRQAAELSAAVFQSMVALELFDDAKVFAMDLCSPKGGYARAALALIRSCELMSETETRRGNTDRLNKITELQAMISAETIKNQEGLLKNDEIFSAREGFNKFKGWIATACMIGSLLMAICLLLSHLNII